MSRTGEAADVDGSGQAATSNSPAVSCSSSLDLASCSECKPKLCPSVVFCQSCVAALCKKCDDLVVHTSKTTRNHVRMKIDEYCTVERGLGGSSPTDEEMKADNENKFFYVSPLDHRIHLRPRLASLVTDPDARPSLVAFIGPTGVGKSTLMRLLVTLDDERDAGRMPLTGAANDAQSTSADIHMYAGGHVNINQVSTHSRVQSAVNVTYPLLYIDSEGRGGSKEPHAVKIMWRNFLTVIHDGISGSYEDFQSERFKHVQESYPRMLYIFSDVLCFVFSGDWRERESIVTPLLEWGRSAAYGAANQHRPQLILIFNKTGLEAAKSEFDNFRKTFETWIQGTKDENRDLLLRYYSDPLVILIPQAAINAAMVLDRVKKLRREILQSTMRVRTSRQQANQLFTRRQLHLYMQLAADTFSNNPGAEFDIYKASMARRPTPVGLNGHIVEFRRAVEQANSQRTSNSRKYRISLNVLQMRIKCSVLLWCGRLQVNLSVGENAQLPKDLREALEQAQEEMAGDQPCAAFRTPGRHCETVRVNHKDYHTRGDMRWSGEFTTYPEVQRAADACRLVNIVESALHHQTTRTMDVKAIRSRLSEVHRSERGKYPWLESFTSYRVCVSCMVALPTEVLSCGHIICEKCAEEEAETRSPQMINDLTCPVCLDSAKWYPRDPPQLAGYRILSLDGGGVRGIVELLSLQEIMSFLPNMDVKDLFDIIVGTSTGGIIALALTQHELDQEPRDLPTVIELFQRLCEQVFSSKMLRPFAGYKYLRLFFQFVMLYHTKYKNDNLLKLLKEHFGEEPLLRSCVGGPHVIVTTCDRDNNLGATWFTSYNRQKLANESDNLITQALGDEEEPATTRTVLYGRVSENHLFSATDAAAASSAAGTYFPAYEADNRYWIDGGLRFNCPAGIAINEGQTMWPKRRVSALISLGCGHLSHSDKNRKGSDSLVQFLEYVVDIATDASSQCQTAIDNLKHFQPDSSGCSLRLNPTIVVPKGENCELDDAKKISFLMVETKKYLKNGGSASVQEAANLLFAALFYLDVEFDQYSQQPILDTLRIRSRAALSPDLRIALINADRLTAPPFSVTVCNAVGAEAEFLWEQLTWDHNVLNLPFKLRRLSTVRPVTVVVKLHMCLPVTTAPKGWPFPISGMPCSLGTSD